MELHLIKCRTSTASTTNLRPSLSMSTAIALLWIALIHSFVSAIVDASGEQRITPSSEPRFISPLYQTTFEFGSLNRKEGRATDSIGRQRGAFRLRKEENSPIIPIVKQTRKKNGKTSSSVKPKTDKKQSSIYALRKMRPEYQKSRSRNEWKQKKRSSKKTRPSLETEIRRLSSLPPHSPLTSLVPTCVFRGWRYTGTTIGLHVVADWQSCQGMCRATPQCNYFAFQELPHFLCSLYFQQHGLLPDILATSGSRDCNVTSDSWGAELRRHNLPPRVHTMLAKKPLFDKPLKSHPAENPYLFTNPTSPINLPASSGIPTSPQQNELSSGPQVSGSAKIAGEMDSELLLDETLKAQENEDNPAMTEKSPDQSLNNNVSTPAGYPLTGYSQSSQNDALIGYPINPYSTQSTYPASSTNYLAPVPGNQINGQATRAPIVDYAGYYPNAIGSTNVFETAQAMVDAGNAFITAFPVQQVFETGSHLFNTGFFRKRGMSATGVGNPSYPIGREKQLLPPPPGVGSPTVTCHHQGMTCCVPDDAVTDWKTKPPYLNGDSSAECRGIFVAAKNAVCATTAYDSKTNCGLVRTETDKLVVNRHVLTIPSKSLNNAICECHTNKRQEEGTENTFQGIAKWEFSLSALADQKKNEIRGEAIAQSMSSALDWASVINQHGSAALDSIASATGNPYPII